jgi:hypothetical protein
MEKTATILVLVAQLFVRVCCLFTTVGMLAASRSWRDEFLIQYCGMFAVSLAGLIACLFLRVYRVTLAAFPDRFNTVLSYFDSAEYCGLLLAHILLSLLFYYYSICAAFRVGSARMYLPPERDTGGTSPCRPTPYAAVQLASRRRFG